MDELDLSKNGGLALAKRPVCARVMPFMSYWKEGGGFTDYLRNSGQEEAGNGLHVRQDGEMGISDKSSGRRCNSSARDRKIDVESLRD